MPKPGRRSLTTGVYCSPRPSDAENVSINQTPEHSPSANSRTNKPSAIPKLTSQLRQAATGSEGQVRIAPRTPLQTLDNSSDRLSRRADVTRSTLSQLPVYKGRAKDGVPRSALAKCGGPLTSPPK